MVRYLFYTIGDLTYQSPLVFNYYTGNMLRRTLWLKERNPAKLGLINHLNTTKDIWLVRIFVGALRKGVGKNIIVREPKEKVNFENLGHVRKNTWFHY